MPARTWLGGAGHGRTVAAVSAGGAVGALARWLASEASGGGALATLAVNVAGCLAMGVLMVVLLETAGTPHPLLRPFLGTGVLGGFTTFSAYSADALVLLLDGHPALAAGYVAGTVLLALLAVQVGAVLTRAATRTRVRREQR